MAEAIRQMVADKIKADNAGFIVKAFPVSLPEALTKVYVSVYRETLTNAPQLAAVTESLKIVVIGPKIGTDVAENELEDALDAVLRSVQALNYIQWSTAERATFSDKYQGYEINLTANTENPYKASA
ncbi:hypothetical protein FCN77_16260 [Arthrobacter sp. 24S4-2]|uniref:hypothetical protein n=1 Tax=Arthrobacter sp. 24S4-2 TaxID=2575374 RepID=UPI0010C7AD0F|nr:hypothetical protein [Arthrobacter sp. 24S4-2]QCO98968.1 hypothetical protein FCN77_16260 [Arthrobacter sp. 24S4-2]